MARPNEKETGFLPVEREWVDRVIENGFVDTFRALHPDRAEAYSYWDPWRERRKRNIGWRIDYVFVSEECAAVGASTPSSSTRCSAPTTVRSGIDLDL